MIRLLIAFVCVSVALQAQSAMNYIFNLDNGARVLYTTYSEVTLKDQAEMFGKATASGNTIERTMTDGSNKTWLGFQLRIERIPGDGPIRFNLSMDPLGGWGFFGQKATPRVIENGDRILLDVVQEPGTGRKLFDSFQVGIGVGMQIMPPARSIPQIPAAGAVIHLSEPRITKAGAPSTIPVGTVSGVMAGELVSTAAGNSRFIFLSHPKPGFRMEAIAEGNRLSFVSGNDMYSFECSRAVMDAPGAWYLWGRVEPVSEK